MTEEEFKEYVKETLSNINSKITKKEQGFINLLGNTFNDVCVENEGLKQENTQLKNKLNNIKKALNGHIDGFITINNYGSCDDILEVLFDLKEVSEGDIDE